LKAQESVRGEIGMGYDYIRELIPDMEATRKFLSNISTDIINSYKNSGNFEDSLKKILSNFPNFGDLFNQMNKAAEKSGYNDSLTKDMLDKLSSATGISGNDIKNVMSPYFNVGGPEYVGTEIIKSTTTNINNSKDNKVNFNLTIDVIHKSMDSTGAIKTINQVERINQSFKDNAFGKKLTINIPNK